MYLKTAGIALLSFSTFFCLSSLTKHNLIAKHSAITKYNPGIEASGGVANSQGLDRTGSPVSSPICSSCHNGGNFNPSISVAVLDGSTPITSYTPGMAYTVRFTISASGTPAGYGMQAVALRSNNTAAGTLTSPSANGQITPLNGRSYLEHQGVSASSIFTATWTAPTSGAGSINFYAMGLAVNNAQGIQGDKATTPVVLTLAETPTSGATVSYSAASYCSNAIDPSPTITGNSSGTFSSSAGLSINTSTGVIDLSASMPGAYNITYTYATGTTSASITINDNYLITANASICEGETYTFGSQMLTSQDAGVHTESFQSAYGCDSIVTLTLSVTTIDSGISLSGDQASANQTNASYQWLDCDNGNSAISGATSQSFTPSSTGNYAVQVGINNCIVISNCVLIDLANTTENENHQLIVYPNPVKDFVAFKDGTSPEYVTINSISGQEIMRLEDFGNTIDLTGLTPGVYFIHVHFGGTSKLIKISKE